MELFDIFVMLSVTLCSHGRVISYPREARLSRADPTPYYFYNSIDGQPGTYSYGYDVLDPATGNSQFRTEERYPNGTVVGSYGYVDPWGRPHRYRYVADERGYRVMQDPTYRPYQEPVPALPVNSGIPESSITWTRPKKPNKKKNDNKYPNRPLNNFIGPPSSYAED